MAQNPVPLTAEYNAMMNAIYANIEKFDTEEDLIWAEFLYKKILNK